MRVPCCSAKILHLFVCVCMCMCARALHYYISISCKIQTLNGWMYNGTTHHCMKRQQRLSSSRSTLWFSQWVCRAAVQTTRAWMSLNDYFAPGGNRFCHELFLSSTSTLIYVFFFYVINPLFFLINVSMSAPLVTEPRLAPWLTGCPSVLWKMYK